MFVVFIPNKYISNSFESSLIDQGQILEKKLQNLQKKIELILLRYEL